METQDLIQLWKSQNESLNKNLQLNRFLLKNFSAKKVKSMLWESRFESWFELVVNILFNVFLVKFIMRNFFEIKFSVPAIFLSGLMIWGIVLCIMKLELIRKINYQMPILEAQKSIEKLKLISKKEIQSLYFVIPLFSVAFMVVIAKSFGVDLYLILGVNVLIYWALGSFAVALIIVWFLKKFPDEGLKKASAFLQEIKAFETDSD